MTRIVSPSCRSTIGIELRQAEGNVILIDQRLGLRQFRGRAVTGLALDVLNILLAGVNVAVTHGFGAGVAIHAVQRVFALGELRDGLIVVVKCDRRLVLPSAQRSLCARS